MTYPCCWLLPASRRHAKIRAGFLCLLLVVAGFPAVTSFAADLPMRAPAEPAQSEPFLRPSVAPLNSIFVFGGYMSPVPIGRTLVFNAGGKGPLSDNYIVGGAYQREFWRWGAFSIAAEVGVADRFGKYEVCCEIRVRSDKTIHTGELWGGFAFRHDGPMLFNAVRLSPAAIVGFSGVTKSIGAERAQEVMFGGDAGFLFYLGLEMALSHLIMPELELVARLHHRSGAWGTLSRSDHEGYNAWIYGIRYRF